MRKSARCAGAPELLVSSHAVFPSKDVLKHFISAGVREIVTEAIYQAYIAQEGAPDHARAAQNLIELAGGATCGEELVPATTSMVQSGSRHLHVGKGSVQDNFFGPIV